MSVDLSAPRPVVQIGADYQVRRPLGLVAALRSQGGGDPWTAGASVRVRTTADLETFFPRYVAAQFADALEPLTESATLGPAVRAFTGARAALVHLAASLVDTKGARTADAPPSVLAALLLDACAERPIAEVRVAASDYVRAYHEMLAVACEVQGEDLAPIYNLDVAHNDVRSRARILPLHPLWVDACFARSERPLNDRLPSVLALSGRGVAILSAEGEPSFYHDRPAIGPTARAIEAAAVAAVLELASTSTPEVRVDLLDTRFAARVLLGVRDALAGAQVPACVFLRFFASTPRDKIDLFVPIEADVLGSARERRLEWEPSVRLVGSTRLNSTAAAVWSPHFGRAPEAETAAPRSAYDRWLVANQIDPVGRPLGVPRIDPAIADRCVAYALRGRAPSSASAWVLRQIDECAVGLRTDRSDGPGANALAREEIGIAATDPRERDQSTPPSSLASTERPRDVATEPASEVRDGRAAVRVFSGEEVVASIARAFGCATSDVADGSALLAGLTRDIVAARRVALRYRLVSEIEALVRSVEGLVTEPDAIADSIERSVLVGDLVERRESERGPYLLELASPTIVRWPGSADAMILGRAGEVLPESAMPSLRLRGAVRLATLSGDDLQEARFRGANLLESTEWAGVPPIETADDRLRRVEMQPFRGDLASFSVFEPRSDSPVYMRRFRERRLTDVLDRDRIALARRAVDYGGVEYRLFRREGERDLAAPIQSQEAVTFVAACVARVGGQPLKARVSGHALRAHFPPTRWMERMAATGSRAPLEGALVAYRLEPDVIAAMARGLRDSMFCDVASE